MMGLQLNHHCDQHPDPFDCPDALVGMFSNGEVGLIVRDGENCSGSSMVLIVHCPWCGKPTGTTLG